nr:hypothetical protein [uncultured Eisenbergiella sp.]
MEKLLSITPHIGGKNGVLGEEIASLLPCEKPDIYIEPYGGSFGVGIQSDYDTENTLLIHNDMDIVLHSIFKAVTQFPEETLNCVYELLEKYDYEQSTVDYFRFVCDYKALTDINLFRDDIVLGAAAWILKMITRNSDCRYLRELHSDNEIEKIYAKFERKEATAFKLQGALTLRMDAMELLRRINRAGRSHPYNIFLYIDAPYSHSGKRTTSQDLYLVDISKDDREIIELAKLLEEINYNTDCKMLVSEYDNPIYNSELTAEKGWKKQKVCDVYKSMSYSAVGDCKPIESEWAWKNY